MFYIIYNLALGIVYPFYLLLSYIWPAAREFRQSRINRSEYPEINPGGVPTIWLHASSVGELDQAIGIARELRKRTRRIRITVSVFSLSVKKLGHPEIDFMFRMPLDSYWVWPRIIDAMKPLAFATMTWDVFPNLLTHLKRRSVPSFLACAALADNSIRLRFPLQSLLRGVYAKLSGVGAVDDENAARFSSLIAPEKVKITGDSRYDTIFHKIKNTKLEKKDLRAIKRPGRTWILASTYSVCDAEIFPHMPDLLSRFPDLNILIFPHFVEETRLREVENELDSHGIKHTRSSLGIGRVSIVDRLGILALAYRFASFCYVGGAFHHRVHNTG